MRFDVVSLRAVKSAKQSLARVLSYVILEGYDPDGIHTIQTREGGLWGVGCEVGSGGVIAKGVALKQSPSVNLGVRL